MSTAASDDTVEIAARSEARVMAFLDAEERRWAPVDPDVVEPLRGLRAFVRAGGKRLRPVFCHWAYVGAGGADLDAVASAGAACELLHAFALLHDDVMDGSERRRGQVTMHLTYERRHGEAGWRGEGRRFGEGVAILVGDLAFVYADRLLAGATSEVRQVWDDLRTEVIVGQYLDLLGAVRGGADLDTARRIATYKTAKYTVERPLHLGAALAGRLAELAAPLSAYGLPLGEAFQLRDDLLGALGDADITGKPVGDDLREGKATALLAVARDRATGAHRAALARIGDPALDDDGVAAAQEAIRATGAADDVEARIVELHGRAVAALEDAPISPAAATALVDLAGRVAWRDR